MSEPLSDDEIREVREVIEQQRRYHWLAGLVRNTAAWIAVVIGAVILMWDSFKNAVRSALP
jgi:hypothetical protein